MREKAGPLVMWPSKLVSQSPSAGSRAGGDLWRSANPRYKAQATGNRKGDTLEPSLDPPTAPQLGPVLARRGQISATVKLLSRYGAIFSCVGPIPKKICLFANVVGYVLAVERRVLLSYDGKYMVVT